MADQQIRELEETLSSIGEDGDAQAKRLLSLLYDDLRKIARGIMRRENAGQTLQPTALVHEAYERLIRSSKGWESEGHFINAAALTMRRIMVDRFRAKERQKKRQEEFGDPEAKAVTDPLDLIAMDEALTALEVHSARKANVVSLKFFGGLNESQIGEILSIDPRQVRRDWAYAKLWMARFMEGNSSSGKTSNVSKVDED